MRNLIVVLACALFCQLAESQVLTGADVLVRSRLALLSGKRVGLVTNQTGRLQNGEFLVDALKARGITVTALFGPEHGVRGSADAGEKVGDIIDRRTGIRVYSLYGTTNKPTAAMLKEVDVLVYDIQDVGVRFYTYISTMYLVMDVAAEHHLPIIVLDRPDPLGGTLVDGPMLEDSLRSFVGMLPIPVVYGLTCGELARMINGERWLHEGVQADLTVVPMEGWRRSMRWQETGIPWVAPSPNIPTPETCYAYPITCYCEATNISEGRGTDAPFETIGAPFVNGDTLASIMNDISPNVRWTATRFAPRSSKFNSDSCSGVRLQVNPLQPYEPTKTAVLLLQTLERLYPDDCKVSSRGLGRLSGTGVFFRCLKEPSLTADALSQWKMESSRFEERSVRYRLYQ